MSSSSKLSPRPLFDGLRYELARNPISPPNHLAKRYHKDYFITRKFLLSYQENEQTYTAYRREVERLLQWCQCRSQKTLKELTKEDIETYIRFCLKPLKSWIGVKSEHRFIEKNKQRIPNSKWHPFSIRLTKAEAKKNKNLCVKDYQLSKKSIQEIFTILNSFFNYLLDEDYVFKNPVARIRQKSSYYNKPSKTVIRRLSELQWGYVVETAEMMAKEQPELHERTLFIINALYGMYLRISELVETKRWTPTMNDFFRDNDGLWWFKTIGKGNKERYITVSQDMLRELKRYRKSLKLSVLPRADDNSPLLPKAIGKNGIKNSRYIRQLVQTCFDRTALRLKEDNLKEEAEQLMSATVHWLRHTGISDDVKIRPREHVRDDAGHSSSAITDKYIDIELRERHRSGVRKRIKPEWLETP